MWNNNFLTVEQVAQITGLSCERVREIAAAKDLIGFKPQGGRRWRFTKQEVAKYMGCKVEDVQMALVKGA